MTIKAYYEKFHKFYTTLPDAVAAEAERTKDVILDLNRDQLLYGRDAKGETLTPSYLDDPYFKKKYKNPLKAAIRYRNMKKELEDFHWGKIRFGHVQLFTDKSPDTPNLLINGNWFMNYLFINISENKYTIDSTGIAANDIQRKYEGYGHPVYGLAPVSVKYYYFGYIRPNAIFKHFKECMK
jgi:hypothetical protein